MNFPKSVNVREVGPRDGLQNEKIVIETADKIAWINQLSDTGLSYIEITSFVHPKWIPQLKDAVEVATGIERKTGVTYAALIPNVKGLERACAAKIDEASIFMSASETHNQKNINKSIVETFPILKEVVEGAKQEKMTTRGYISTVFGCPYEGQVDIEEVIRVAERLFEMGIDELSLGDTIGVANPLQVQLVLDRLLHYFPKEKLAMHFHDTRGTALANVVAALEMGVTTFDGAVGGLGGCPYAPGASGNAATEDLIYMLNGMGIETGVLLRKLLKASKMIATKLEKSLPSHNLQAFLSSCEHV